MDVKRVLAMAVRSLGRRPGFAIMVLFCLAAGLAVSVAAAGVAKQVLIDPLPFEEAEGLRVLYRSDDADRRTGLTYGAAGDIAQSAAFDGVAVVHVPTFDEGIVLTGGDVPERVEGLRVSPTFFEVLDVRPERGRPFDTSPTGGQEVLVSHAAWQTRFGGAEVVGRRVEVGGEPATIVGVLPASFRYEVNPEAEVFVATRPAPQLAADREARIFHVLARTDLQGTDLQSVLAGVDRGIREAAPQDDLPTLRAAPVRDFFFGDVRRPLLFLAAAGALTLLVAVVNITLLILARAQERAPTDSVRLAIGAGRVQLVAGPVAEAVILGLVAAILGLLGADLLVSGFAGFVTGELPVRGLALDLPLMAGALVLGVGATATAALLATAGTRTVDLGALRARNRGLDRRALRRWNLLIGAQTALVAFLLVAAGLTGRSLMKMLDVDPGFDPVQAWSIPFELPRDRYGSLERVDDFMRQAESALGNRPEIMAVGAASNLPLTPGWSGLVEFRDREWGEQARPSVGWEVASPGYFRAMGIPTREGRTFTDRDGPDAPRVAVINETMARELWPEGGAVGAMISASGRPDDWARVVGVVGDVHRETLTRDPGPAMYVPHGQLVPLTSGEMVVRAAPGAAASAAAAARAALLELEPGTVIGAVRGLDYLIRNDTAASRLQGALLGLFAITALLLGLAGIFGVVSYAVSRRSRELGIRMALGSTPTAVMRRVLGQGLLPVMAGGLAGLFLAYSTGAYFEHLLFETSAADPLVFLGLPPLLAATAAAALLIPALRAARTDPARVLTTN